jgi:hypothetical protein
VTEVPAVSSARSYVLVFLVATLSSVLIGIVVHDLWPLGAAYVALGALVAFVMRFGGQSLRPLPAAAAIGLGLFASLPISVVIQFATPIETFVKFRA